MKHPIWLVATALLAAPIVAQAPAGPPAVSQDPAKAPSGNYVLDGRHASVIVRLPHAGGVSFSTFRLGTVAGTLNWNGTQPEASKTSITIDMTSLQSPVPNFAAELIGDRFLKTSQFHDAQFVSTSIQRTGATTGTIGGNLTFMGVTKPVTIDANLVGTNTGGRGPVIGFSGRMHFKRSDFGFNALQGPIGDDVELLIDVEFDKAA